MGRKTPVEATTNVTISAHSGNIPLRLVFGGIVFLHLC